MAERLDTSKIEVIVDNRQAINKLGEQESKYAALSAEVKGLEAEVRKYNKAQQTLNSKGIDKQSKAYKNAEKTVKQLQGSFDRYNEGKADLDKLTTSIKKQRNELGLQGQTLAQLTRQQRQLRSEIRNTTTKGTAEYKRMTAELKAINAEVAKQNKNLKATGKQAPEIGKVNSAWGGMKSTLGDIVGIGGQGGLYGAIAAGIVLVVKEGLELEKQFTRMRNEVERFSGASGAALSELTVDVKSLADTFDKDFNEVLNATNSLSEQMEISFDDAFTLIERGFIQGADAQGDFLDKVREYPVQFKEAGLTAEDFIKIATQEVRGGVFSDKLIDSVKELGLRLRELTPAAQKALEPLGGEFVDAIVSDLRTGSRDIISIFRDIINRSKELGLSAQETQTLIADLGGGPLEDLGGLEEAFRQLDDAMLINLDSLDKLGMQQQATLDVQKEVNTELNRLAENFQGTSHVVSNVFNKALATSLGLFNEYIENFHWLGKVSKLVTEDQESLLEQLPRLRQEYDQVAAKLQEEEEFQKKLGIQEGARYEMSVARQKGLQAELEQVKKQLTLAEDANLQFEQKQRDAIAANIEGSGVIITNEEKKDEATKKRTQSLKDQREQERLRAQEARAFAKQVEEDTKRIESLTSDRPQASFLEAVGLIPTEEEKAEADMALEEARLRLGLRRQIAEEARQWEIQNAATEAERIALQREEELRKTNEHFDMLKAQAEQYGLDTTQIFETRRTAIAAIEKSYNEEALKADQEGFNERLAAASAFVSTLTDISTSLAELGIKNAGFSKALAITQIAIDTSIALSSAITKAVAAAGNPFQIIAQVAIATAAVLSAFAQVNSRLSGAKEPSKPSFEGGGLAKGPRHSQGGIPGWVKGSGAIEFEGGEYITNRAATAQNMDAIRTINADGGRTKFTAVPTYGRGGPVANPRAASYVRGNRYQDGGLVPPTPTASGQASDSQALEESNAAADEQAQLLRAILGVVQRWPTVVRAFITQSDFNDAVDDKREIDQIESNANL